MSQKRKWDAENKEHRKLYNRAWYAENRERDRAYQSAWRVANQEKERNRHRSWRAANRKKERNRYRSWYAANRDKELARRQARFDRNKDIIYHRTWRARNHEKVTAAHHKRHALKRNAPGSFTEIDLKLLWKKQRGRCKYCKSKLTKKTKTVDHIKPLSKGGSNKLTNLAWACVSCNCRKGTKELAAFLKEIK